MKAPEDISGTEGTPKTRWDEIRIASSKPSTENSTHEPQPESHTEDPFLIGDSLGNNTDKGNKPKLNKYGDIIE